MKHTARAPTTATELTVISPCAQSRQTNPNSRSPARTEHRFSLGTKTACSRDLHFQRPFRVDRRHATVMELQPRRVLANHVAISWTWGILSGDVAWTSPNHLCEHQLKRTFLHQICGCEPPARADSQVLLPTSLSAKEKFRRRYCRNTVAKEIGNRPHKAWTMPMAFIRLWHLSDW